SVQGEDIGIQIGGCYYEQMSPRVRCNDGAEGRGERKGRDGECIASQASQNHRRTKMCWLID
ncbi:hypothetical protein KUCAC02_027213, partial [Chaenocephalus aceratus]